MNISKYPDLMVDWELLLRKLIGIREKFGMPWDDDMEEIMRNRDNLYLHKTTSVKQEGNRV